MRGPGVPLCDSFAAAGSKRRLSTASAWYRAGSGCAAKRSLRSEAAASKRFNNIHTYDFTLATEYSTDGGQSWHDSAAFALPAGATVMTDPTMAWDDSGNVFLVGLVGNNLLQPYHIEFAAGTPIERVERAVYVRSTWRF